MNILDNFVNLLFVFILFCQKSSVSPRSPGSGSVLVFWIQDINGTSDTTNKNTKKKTTQQIIQKIHQWYFEYFSQIRSQSPGSVSGSATFLRDEPSSVSTSIGIGSTISRLNLQRRPVREGISLTYCPRLSSSMWDIEEVNIEPGYVETLQNISPSQEDRVSE